MLILGSRYDIILHIISIDLMVVTMAINQHEASRETANLALLPLEMLFEILKYASIQELIQFSTLNTEYYNLGLPFNFIQDIIFPKIDKLNLPSIVKTSLKQQLRQPHDSPTTTALTLGEMAKIFSITFNQAKRRHKTYQTRETVEHKELNRLTKKEYRLANYELPATVILALIALVIVVLSLLTITSMLFFTPITVSLLPMNIIAITILTLSLIGLLLLVAVGTLYYGRGTIRTRVLKQTEKIDKLDDNPLTRHYQIPSAFDTKLKRPDICTLFEKTLKELAVSRVTKKKSTTAAMPYNDNSDEPTVRSALIKS